MTYQDDLSRGIEAVKNRDLETAKELVSQCCEVKPRFRRRVGYGLEIVYKTKTNANIVTSGYLYFNPKNVEAQENSGQTIHQYNFPNHQRNGNLIERDRNIGRK